jgi:hypothetical protein
MRQERVASHNNKAHFDQVMNQHQPVLERAAACSKSSYLLRTTHCGYVDTDNKNQ